MKSLVVVALLAVAACCQGQIVTSSPQRAVPVSDNSGLVMDIYKQTNAQNAQLASMNSEMISIKETLSRIETSQKESDGKFESLRHDVDKQGVIANLFVYSAQTLFTIIIAIFISVPGTFFVQKLLSERFSKSVTPTTAGEQ